jgi:hypothetical protein
MPKAHMSIPEIRFWWTAACGIAAYLVPLILWLRRKSTFPTQLFLIPVLVVGSWWLADAVDIRSGRVGFTFYGALPAAVLSNLLIVGFWRFRNFQSRRMLWNATLVLGCLLVGVVLQLVLPPLAE